MSRAQSANHPFDERMADVVARYTAANIDFTRDSAAHLPVNDVLAPYCIDTESSPRYIIVDGIYYMCCYLPSNAYPVRVLGGWMQLLAGLGEGIDVDVWLQKISPEKIQTALHHGLRFNAMRFRNTETTSSDYDDVKAAVDAGYYLKSSLSAGDEFAYMSTMLTITGESEREIDYKFKEIRRIFIERELTLKPCTFQQAEAFRSTIPVCEYDKNLFRKSRRNILCSDFASTYMFTSSELCDKDGVMLGVDDVFKSPVLVNFFDRQQYINANINIVGSSGSGKTFTTQVLALRMREKGVQTFIIAPLKGKEFLPLCEKVGGSFIEIKPGSGQNINIMEIRKKEEGNVYDDDGALVTSGSILAQKIQQLLIFFKLKWWLAEHSAYRSIAADCVSKYSGGCIRIAAWDYMKEPQEIDHLLVGPAGVIHIETKNYVGTIRVDDTNYWDRDMRNAGHFTTTESPAFQVKRHAALLSKIVGEDVPVCGIICLANPNVKLQDADNSEIPVVKLGELPELLDALDKSTASPLTAQKVTEVIGKIEKAKVRGVPQNDK